MSEHISERDPFELTHDDVDDDEFRRELDEDIERHVDPENERLHAELKEMQAHVDEMTATISTVIDDKEIRAEIARPNERADVAIGDDTPNEALEKKRSAAEEAEEAGAKANEKTSQAIASKFVGLVLGVALVGAIVMEIIKQLKATGNAGGHDKSPLDDATIEKLKKRYQEWCAQPDHEFWTTLADYVDAHDDMSLGDQIGFLNLVVMLAPDCGGFIWDSGADQSAAADELVRAYRTGGNKSSALYRKAADLTYQGQPVPRVATAQVMRLALAWVGVTATSGADS